MVSNIDYTGDRIAKKQAAMPHPNAEQHHGLPRRRPVCQSLPMRSPNYYAAPGFERGGLRRRESEWIRARVLDPASVFVPVWRNQNLVIEVEGGEPRAAGIAEGEVAQIGVRFADLRQLAGRLDRQEGALLALARAMMFWHSRHRHCGLCGNPTRSEEAGHMRRCSDPGCDTMHFPRTDPAVIMLVTDGDRALLGRNKNFPVAGMYSTLAGFVEPGESLEDAVAREVREETAIEVAAVHYHSSQPWPFPANIMLGFYAAAATTEVSVDYGELEDARWFERDWLASHADDDTFRLPRRDSIARRLIEDWLAD